MAYEDEIKAFKREILLMEVMEDRIKDFTIEKSYQADQHGLEEVTITMTFYRMPGKKGSRRFMDKPELPADRMTVQGSQFLTGSNLTSTVNGSNTTIVGFSR